MPDAPTPRHPSFSVNLPLELRRALEAIAARELSTIGHVIRRACVLEVERHRRAQRRWEQTERAGRVVKARKPRLVRVPPRREDAVRNRPADFSDGHSQDVFTATVRVWAREMGHQAYLALRSGKVPR